MHTIVIEPDFEGPVEFPSWWGFTLYQHDESVPYAEGELLDRCFGYHHDGAPTTLQDLERCGIKDDIDPEVFEGDWKVEVLLK